MSVSKFFTPKTYLNAMRFRYKIFKRKQKIQSFISGANSLEDKMNAYQLFLSMESPFEQRPKEVREYIAHSGSNISFRHKYFANTRLNFDLSDNFQMAISQEFFIQNVYDLSKVNFEPSLVIDCGGYKGYFTWLALAKFRHAKFICIEAHPDNYRDILKTAQNNKINSVEVLHAAVSKSAEPVEFFFEGSSGSMENTFSAEGIHVSVKPVDLYNLILGQKDLLLKIDIEGAELDFLPGIIDFLPENCAVFFEIHDGWNSLGSIKDNFSENGFSFEVITEREQFIDCFAQRISK